MSTPKDGRKKVHLGDESITRGSGGETHKTTQNGASPLTARDTGFRRPVALLVSEGGANKLASDPAAREFIADAFAHLKFIGYVLAAKPLMEKAGAAPGDQGLIALGESVDISHFIQACRALRFWDRQPKVKASV